MVSPTHCVTMKGGWNIISNKHNELKPIRINIGWRVYIDYSKMNILSRKVHLRLPFLDQMLDMLDGHQFYCFLDGYSSYQQIGVAPADQYKTNFTSPYKSFAFRRFVYVKLLLLFKDARCLSF